MAARRLLILMLVLLGISSVIAVIIPNPRRDAREREAREAAQSEEPAGGKSGAAGKGEGEPAAVPAPPREGSGPDQVTVGASGAARAVTVKPGNPVQEIEARPGGRLVLTVEADRPSQVLIPRLGRTGFADRWAPAVFDLILPPEATRLPVLTATPDAARRTRRAVIAVAEP